MDELWNRLSGAITPIASKIAEPVIGSKPAAPYEPLQRIGIVRDRSECFVRKRTEIQSVLEMSVRNHIAAVGKALRSAPRASSVPAVAMGVLRSGSAAALDSFCRTCGDEFGVVLGVKRRRCGLCALSFCARCVVTLPIGSPPGTAGADPGSSPLGHLQLDDKGRLVACHGCEIKASRLEKQHRWQQALAASARSPLVVTMQALQRTKQQIVDIFPRYEYLADSLSHNSQCKTANLGTIWQESMQLAAELQRLLAAFDVALRQLAAVAVEPGSRTERLKQVMSSAMSSYVQLCLPRFRQLRKQLIGIELKAVNSVFVIVCRLCHECGAHAAFWGRFGQPLRQLQHEVAAQLQDAVHSCGEQWLEHQQALEAMLASWETHSAPLLQLKGQIQSEPEASLIRKTLSVLRQCEAQLTAHVGQHSCGPTGSALRRLITQLDDTYARQSMALARQAALLGDQPASTPRRAAAPHGSPLDKVHADAAARSLNADDTDFDFVVVPNR
eukprot:TRINITY_DN7354_c0_g1_i1.p1 TRINITY_DN7354_c0_g1~~TRINITY_DN7354_c0_g1_i1.p1  ORF type:complete len:508 (+),score=141.32 TRINITY_DN7354_c0_g1_i1:27-1526(+)